MKKCAFRIVTLALTLALLALAVVACSSETNVEGFAFKSGNGVSVSIGDLDHIVDKLGDHPAPTESPSCGGIEGKDRVYTFAGFRVKTTPAKKGDVVCQIELTDDSVKTPEGLYIGMSAEDAKTAMGGKGTMTAVGDGFQCVKGNTKLQVTVRDGAVSAITYLEA